jgi:hypothetical protein
MNKDVIYIDVDDDITAIISKVKASKEKIVALVPPKRIGVLQSAVNLHLLTRAASHSSKRLVLISNNQALMALAASAKIPVAKNLQSKPELAEISALEVDDDDDIIDGNDLPVGDHAKTSESAIEKALKADDTPKATPPQPGQMPLKPKAKSGVKVPNFSAFRKKLILMIGGGILLIGFSVWAIFFAPHATVVITARTSDSSTNVKVSLAQTLTTSLEKNTIKAVTQDQKNDVSVDFTPTGSKDVGTKAGGSMTITRSGVSDSPTTIPAGTQFTSGSLVFVSTAAVVVPRSEIVGSSIDNGSATVAVTAEKVGEEYNLSARNYQSGMSGFSARGTDMAGGTKKTIKVVSADDIAKATEQLKQQKLDEAKTALKGEFDKTVKILDSTFAISVSGISSSPGQDQEVSGDKAKLTASVTYSMTGVDKVESSKYLDDYFKKQIGDKGQQRVYDNGVGAVNFTNVTGANGTFTANIVATAKIGPKIDDENIKSQTKGKRYGEIQAAIESIQGVDNVDVKFWPFWVSAAPDDTNKISVEFNLDESE